MNQYNRYASTSANVPVITLGQIDASLFSDVAEQTARAISQNKDKNKSAQLRRFYDELVMWHDKVCLKTPDQRDEKYKECAPYIQMLLAKANYSMGRGHVTQEFVDMLKQLLRQIKNADTLKQAKLFFEAVLGFRRAME